jgi:hypothetical protein
MRSLPQAEIEPICLGDKPDYEVLMTELKPQLGRRQQPLTATFAMYGGLGITFFLLVLFLQEVAGYGWNGHSRSVCPIYRRRRGPCFWWPRSTTVRH